MKSILAPILIFILMIAALIFIPRLMIRRAIKQTIAIFRHYGIFRADQAKTRSELGLNPPDFMARITSLRDYKPSAMQILINEGVILSTEDGKLYMDETKLNEFLRKRM
jgi:hypothetical protein